MKNTLIPHNSMDFDLIFKNNEEWITGKLAVDQDYFGKLTEGQSPEILYIGCSDSRVTAEEIFGAAPGELFVHRNIANMVISIDLNVMSVINYAVDHLKVKRIVVCGHYDCGGVKASLQAEDRGILNPWLRNIRDVYRMHRDELDAISDPHLRFDRLVELNVLEQCVNVLKTAAVQLAFKERGLSVHGWVFDMRSGRLVDLKIDFPAILKNINEIYRLID